MKAFSITHVRQQWKLVRPTRLQDIYNLQSPNLLIISYRLIKFWIISVSILFPIAQTVFTLYINTSLHKCFPCSRRSYVTHTNKNVALSFVINLLMHVWLLTKFWFSSTHTDVKTLSSGDSEYSYVLQLHVLLLLLLFAVGQTVTFYAGFVIKNRSVL